MVSACLPVIQQDPTENINFIFIDNIVSHVHRLFMRLLTGQFERRETCDWRAHEVYELCNMTKRRFGSSQLYFVVLCTAPWCDLIG